MAESSDTLITTRSGPVQGSSREHTLVWTGIPYAKAPEGTLRWKAPQPPAHRTTVFDATRPATDCVQVTPDGTRGQEDCLNLNVYRPKNVAGKLPVLVYIHGGNNQLGSSTEFEPEYIAGRLNAVIVTLNYRLGALGFNPLNALNTGEPTENSGNFTLLDIKQALSWVRNNIDNFGGDSNNITVSGFSAGGRDVMAMLISPLFAYTFNKAIVFSGGMTTSDKKVASGIFADRLAPQVVHQGIRADTRSARTWLLDGSPDVRTFLYRLPAEKLAGLFGDAGIRMSQFPHLYRDGVVLPLSGFDTLKYNAVPVIMVTGLQEFSFFARNDAMFSAAVKAGSLAKNTTLFNKYQFANRYGGLMYSLFNVTESAEKMYPHYDAPIYGMEFRYGSDVFVTGDRLAQIGSFHGVFMPFWDKHKYAEFTQEAMALEGSRQLGDTFNRYIRQFLVSGSPNSRTLPPWLRWSPEHAAAGKSLVVMDANKQKALIYMSNKSYTSADILREMEKDPTLTPAEKRDVMTKVLNGRWFSAPLDAHLKQ
ncbi:TPA: carboxylesterase family protein [Enterobacter hormaechei subsp. steigerwaltii]|nr:carboxylesterase family protein [Enterobacter hormaechei subsp. steigerwaltii]